VKDPRGIKAWWTAENLESFDGLPGLQFAHNSRIEPINAFDRASSHQSPSQTKNTNKSVDSRAGKSSAVETSKLLLAFGLGVMVTAGYVRLASLGGVRVPLPWSG